MVDVLLATCADLPDGDDDAGLLDAALARAGVVARWAAWTDPQVDWSGALTVLRSTWDYTLDVGGFLTWLRGLDCVQNPAPVITWSSDKTYLRDLAAHGVPIVETQFVTPGQLFTPPAGEYVVKPSVGAGSRGAGRFGPGEDAAARAHAEQLQAAGRTMLVQPYVAGVDEQGETALVFVDGRFTHAVRKGAMLGASTRHPVHGSSLYIEENISPRDAGAAELALGEQVLGVVRELHGVDPLYARVDLLPSAAGPVVVELELAEPSLFLGYAPRPEQVSDLLATAIAARL